MRENQAHKTAVRQVPAILVAVLIFGIFCAALSQAPWFGFRLWGERGSTGYQENPWTLTQGDQEISTRLDLPEYMELEKGKLYTLSTRVTYNGTIDEMPYGFIHLDHMYCRVLLNGEVLFSCMPEDVERWDRAKSPGFIYKAFPVPADCMGQLLEIQLLPMLDLSVEYGLPELCFGDFPSSLRQAVIRDMPHDVITILCMLMGAAATLFSTATLHGPDYREGISIGVFSLLFSLYLITECQFNAYFIGNPYYLYLLNYIAFSLMPIALMCFMRERLPEKYRVLCTWVIRGELAFFVLEQLLHFGGVLDMREAIPAIHLIYFSEVALVTVLLQTMKDKKRKRSLILQMTPVMIGMLADALIYWLHWDIGGNDATFTILGVICFLMVELIHVWRSSIGIYTESVRSKLYRQMAYVDGLTGVGNRRAYDKAIEKIASGETEFRSMLVVSADVNRLKYANDHYGHAAGDRLIRGAAQIMVDSVGSRGEVFRTGGDEFAAFLYNIDIPQYEAMYQAAARRMEAFNAENEFSLSLAVGYVELQDHKILEAVQEADRRMYANKMKLKMAREQQTD